MSSTPSTSTNHFAAPRGIVCDASAAIIKATLAPVVDNLDTIVATFYKTMLSNNPEVLAFFNITNQRTGEQGKSLAASLLAAVPCTLEPGKLEALAAHLGVVFHKHVALGVKPEHYAIVHDNFMKAVAAVLGDAVTPEVAAAWSEAVMVVADVFIRYEVALEASVAAATNGWREPEAMKVIAVENAANDGSAKSVTLEMVNPDIACVHKPGQYLTLYAPAEWGVNAPRHYTITGGDLKSLSITVKKMVGSGDGVPNGLLSSYINDLTVGDIVHARPPMGIFTAPPKPNVEVCIAGGVGVTPILQLAKASSANGAKIVVFVSSHSSDSAILADEVHALAQLPGVIAVNEAFTGQGDDRITAAAVVAALAAHDIVATDYGVNFNLCGPREFMRDLIAGLHAEGIDASAIHFETFGPTGDLTA